MGLVKDGCRSSKIHEFTSSEYLARFPVPSSSSSCEGLKFNECHYCTLRVIVSCWSLLRSIGIPKHCRFMHCPCLPPPTTQKQRDSKLETRETQLLKNTYIKVTQMLICWHLNYLWKSLREKMQIFMESSKHNSWCFPFCIFISSSGCYFRDEDLEEWKQSIREK